MACRPHNSADLFSAGPSLAHRFSADRPALLTTVNAAFALVNAALTTANTALTLVNAVLTTANAAFTTVSRMSSNQSSGSFAHVDAAFTTVNTAFTTASDLPSFQSLSMLSSLSSETKPFKINSLQFCLREKRPFTGVLIWPLSADVAGPTFTRLLQPPASCFAPPAVCGRRSGNKITSRIDRAPVRIIVSRSIPMPSPAVGGSP